ncbi:MAG: L-threonylcarbamoyladenylate synthase [Acidobacteriota bacterium]
MVSTTKEDLARARAILDEGGLVAIPTETVYGLAARAFDARAVASIFERKGRPRFDPLIVHVAEVGELGRVARSRPAAVDLLADRFWPGPLTLVLPKAEEVPALVSAGLDSVGVRVPDHPLTRELLSAVGPLAAPSANRFGRVSPTTVEHVRAELGEEPEGPFVLDGGPCRTGLESTVLSLLDDRPRLLRPGGVTLEELEAVLGPVESGVTPATEAPESPGQLASHYAPRTPIVPVTEAELAGRARPEAGLLCLRRPPSVEGWGVVEELSATGDLVEAASRLFAALHRLDASGLMEIAVLPVPEEGLGRAIADRLRRAAVRTRTS